jgi:hypothetical protein
MQKIKDKSQKIKVKHSQSTLNCIFRKLISMIVLRNVLKHLSLAFCLLSFMKFMN